MWQRGGIAEMYFWYWDFFRSSINNIAFIYCIHNKLISSFQKANQQYLTERPTVQSQ